MSNIGQVRYYKYYITLNIPHIDLLSQKDNMNPSKNNLAQQKSRQGIYIQDNYLLKHHKFCIDFNMLGNPHLHQGNILQDSCTGEDSK
jgi:hypothetical protein